MTDSIKDYFKEVENTKLRNKLEEDKKKEESEKKPEKNDHNDSQTPHPNPEVHTS